MPEVSVIIPCYNMGQYLDEAVESVLNQTYRDFEIIIVNDGSTNEKTNELLRDYQRPQTRVLHTSNQGLSAARNNGISIAQCKYILPLDADDRIGATYLEQAVRVLDERDEVGIVYCEAEYFGYRSDKWNLPEYRFPDILLENVIFCSGFFRRTDWETVGGYKSNLPAWEDYDFWLSLVELGRDVYRIPNVLFYYRQRDGSMIKSMSWEQHVNNYAQVMKNHAQLYSDNLEFMVEHILTLRSEAERAKSAVSELQDTVESMRRSRFWKLREHCVRLMRHSESTS